MRIRKRFPSFPIVPSSVASSSEAPSKQEGMEVSSFPVPDERTAREASGDYVLTEWKDIKARAHKLGSSSHGANYRTVQPFVQDARSSTGPLIKKENGTELQSGNGMNESFLEQENPTENKVIKQGGGFSNSKKKRKYSGTGMSNCKRVIVSSSQNGNGKYGKAESAVRIGSRKERTKSRPLMGVGSSRRACANGSPGMEYKYEADDEGDDGYSSASSTEGKVRMRSLRSVYADLGRHIPASQF